MQQHAQALNVRHRECLRYKFGPVPPVMQFHGSPGHGTKCVRTGVLEPGIRVWKRGPRCFQTDLIKCDVSGDSKSDESQALSKAMSLTDMSLSCATRVVSELIDRHLQVHFGERGGLQGIERVVIWAVLQMCLLHSSKCKCKKTLPQITDVWDSRQWFCAVMRPQLVICYRCWKSLERLCCMLHERIVTNSSRCIWRVGPYVYRTIFLFKRVMGMRVARWYLFSKATVTIFPVGIFR